MARSTSSLESLGRRLSQLGKSLPLILALIALMVVLNWVFRMVQVK